MGQLNIKDDKVIAEAKAMASRRGTSVTELLRRLLTEEAARDAAERQRRFDAMMAIAERASKLFPPGTPSGHGDFYDEHGLPR